MIEIIFLFLISLLIISHLTLIRDLLFGLTSAHVGKCIFYEAFSRQQPTRNLIIACQKATALKNSFLLVVFWTLVRPIMTKVSIIINYCPFSKFTEAKLVIFHSRNIQFLHSYIFSIQFWKVNLKMLLP